MTPIPMITDAIDVTRLKMERASLERQIEAIDRSLGASQPADDVVERVRFILDFLRDAVRVGGVDRKEQMLAWKLIDEARSKLAALSQQPNTEVEAMREALRAARVLVIEGSDPRTRNEFLTAALEHIDAALSKEPGR